MQLPKEFISNTRAMMGESLSARFLAGLDAEPPVSIRLNPPKSAGYTVVGGERVPWCEAGYYLDRRPLFTFDPLLHAGCYYVQEAASMFVAHVLRQHVTAPVDVLDLCAAPGGKTTAAMGALPQGCRFWANEPVRQRAQVLGENISKWGGADCTVTNNYPHDYPPTGLRFDVILADVPCSGEGMFRKDPKAVDEWSVQNVEKCWRLQRQIVSDIWPCLKPGGLLVYSTCTFNTLENEANVRWIADELGADVLPVATRPEWGITGSLLQGFDAPVYRFIPGITRSEGLFMAVMRKADNGSDATPTRCDAASRRGRKGKAGGRGLNIVAPPPYYELPVGDTAATVELTYAQALAYLQRQALVLPDGTPTGLVAVSFEGHRLGQVKNIGARANNLYPQEWRIRTTHIPNDYETILRHT